MTIRTTSSSGTPSFTLSSKATVSASRPALSATGGRMGMENSFPLSPFQNVRRRVSDRSQNPRHAFGSPVPTSQRQEHPVPVFHGPHCKKQPRQSPLSRLIQPHRVARCLLKRCGRLVGERLQQGFPPGKVPEESAPHDTGGSREFLHRDVRVSAELVAGRVQDARPVGPCIAALRRAGHGLGHDKPPMLDRIDEATAMKQRLTPSGAGELREISPGNNGNFHKRWAVVVRRPVRGHGFLFSLQREGGARRGRRPHPGRGRVCAGASRPFCLRPGRCRPRAG